MRPATRAAPTAPTWPGQPVQTRRTLLTLKTPLGSIQEADIQKAPFWKLIISQMKKIELLLTICLKHNPVKVKYCKPVKASLSQKNH
jgi:hypothetical protein